MLGVREGALGGFELPSELADGLAPCHGGDLHKMKALKK